MADPERHEVTVSFEVHLPELRPAVRSPIPVPSQRSIRGVRGRDAAARAGLGRGGGGRNRGTSRLSVGKSNQGHVAGLRDLDLSFLFGFLSCFWIVWCDS